MKKKEENLCLTPDFNVEEEEKKINKGKR